MHDATCTHHVNFGYKRDESTPKLGTVSSQSNAIANLSQYPSSILNSTGITKADDFTSSATSEKIKDLISGLGYIYICISMLAFFWRLAMATA